MKVWITFKLNERRVNAKTDTWGVWDIGETESLGEIRWYTPWRKYCFFPYTGTVFEQDCLNRIAEFLVSETAKHRKVKP
jgi:hypothetical protein